MHKHHENIEPNDDGEIMIGSPHSIENNFDTELYEWDIENK